MILTILIFCLFRKFILKFCLTNFHPEYRQEDHHEYSEQQTPEYTPVHEAGRTYSAPARHSLHSPIIPTASATQSPYLAQQPQYVYVRAEPNKYPSQHHQQAATTQQVEEEPTKVQEEVQSNSLYDIGNVQQQYQYDSNPITYAQYYQPVTYDGSQYQQHASAEQSQGSYAGNQQQYIQYIPYIKQGP